MDRTPVKSSQIVSIGYDAGTRVLEVEFIRGAIYTYEEVPFDLYRDFIAAESKGRFFGMRVRGKFPYKKEAEDANAIVKMVEMMKPGRYFTVSPSGVVNLVLDKPTVKNLLVTVGETRGDVCLTEAAQGEIFLSFDVTVKLPLNVKANQLLKHFRPEEEWAVGGTVLIAAEKDLPYEERS